MSRLPGASCSKTKYCREKAQKAQEEKPPFATLRLFAAIQFGRRAGDSRRDKMSQNSLRIGGSRACRAEAASSAVAAAAKEDAAKAGQGQSK